MPVFSTQYLNFSASLSDNRKLSLFPFGSVVGLPVLGDNLSPPNFCYDNNIIYVITKVKWFLTKFKGENNSLLFSLLLSCWKSLCTPNLPDFYLRALHHTSRSTISFLFRFVVLPLKRKWRTPCWCNFADRISSIVANWENNRILCPPSRALPISSMQVSSFAEPFW